MKSLIFASAIVFTACSCGTDNRSEENNCPKGLQPVTQYEGNKETQVCVDVDNPGTLDIRTDEEGSLYIHPRHRKKKRR
jgi:hypothetical protein